MQSSNTTFFTKLKMLGDPVVLQHHVKVATTTSIQVPGAQYGAKAEFMFRHLINDLLG